MENNDKSAADLTKEFIKPIKEVVNPEDILACLRGDPLLCLTESTTKYESPDAREKREKKEATDQAQRHWMERARIIIASIAVLVFLALACYLFALKSDATETQRTVAVSILSSIASGGAVYAFGKKPKTPQNDD